APQVARIVVDVRDEIVHVDASGIEDRAARVVDRQQPGAEAAEDLRGIRSDVSESLEDEAATGGCGAALREPFLDAVREPLSGGLTRPSDPPMRVSLPVTTPRSLCRSRSPSVYWR